MPGVYVLYHLLLNPHTYHFAEQQPFLPVHPPVDTNRLPAHDRKFKTTTHVVDTRFTSPLMLARVMESQTPTRRCPTDGHNPFFPAAKGNSVTLWLPAESDVNGQFVTFSLVCQAVVTRVT